MKVSETLNMSKMLLEVIRRNAADQEIQPLANTTHPAIGDIEKAISLAQAMEAVVEAAQVCRELGPHSMQARIKLYDAVDALNAQTAKRTP